MSEKDMTVCSEVKSEEEMEVDQADVSMSAKDLEDLEEGECSDDDEEVAAQAEAVEPVQEEPVVVVKEKSRHRDEKKEKKHKRRSRSDSRERHRSRKHKKKKLKEKDREKKELEDEDDEEAKKKAMLRKMRNLEGAMGLVESEEEESSDSSSSYGKDKKRKRERAGENEWGRKKWKGPEKRPCNLFMQGKCPRDAEECLFSHDFYVPKTFELCKFYVYDKCVKKDKCLYLHKEFPCKFYHLGFQCNANAETCKFSHEPLDDSTRNLLLKHVETAPKELLGDFPRLTRQEATAAVFNTEAKHNGWTLPDKSSPRIKSASRWDRAHEPPMPGQQAFPFGPRPDLGGHPGMQGHNVMDQGNAWGGGTVGILGPAPPTHANNKPTGLMDVKLNEQVIQKFLSDKKKESDNEDRDSNKGEDGQAQTDNGGDETPEITPPVSPSERMEPTKLPNIPKTQLKLYQRIQQKQKDTNMSEDNVGTQDWSDNYYSDEEDSAVLKNVLSNLEAGNNSPTVRGQRRESNSSNSEINPTNPSNMGDLSPSMNSPITKKGDKKDPRLHKVDPRKEKQAKKDEEERLGRERELQREEEERLEREKDQRIMDLDLGSVFGELDLPPLSPKQTVEEKYLSDKLGLPFKPYIYHVAKEIEASIHSHSPIPWTLIAVDVPERDYSDVKHHFSPSQMEMDPRLRRFTKTGMAKLKDLPMPAIPAMPAVPSMPAPKSDPRLKKVDPRKAAHAESRRRSSEDSEGNHVYNPARELNKGMSSGLTRQDSYPSGQCESPQGQNVHQNMGNFGYGDDQYQGGDEGFNQDGYYPENDVGYEGHMGYDSYSSEYGDPKMAQKMPHGYHENTEAHDGMGSRMMGGINRGRQGFVHRPRFPGGRGFPPIHSGVNRGQWIPRFGRGDFRGNRLDPRTENVNQIRTRDPRVK